MIINLISLNSNGLFVLLSFGIAIIACSIMYFRTRKTLKKYEREFAAELEQLSNTEKKAVLEKSKIANQVLVSQKRTA